MKSFTLIEMVIAMAVLAVLAGVLLISTNSGSNLYNMNNELIRLQSSLDQARSFSLANQKFNGVQPTGGWGMYFETGNDNNTFYTIFADADNNKDFTSDEVKTKMFLPNELVISKLETGDLNGTMNNISSLKVIFIPPHPDICINCSDILENTDARITIRDIKGNEKNITINALGGINY